MPASPFWPAEREERRLVSLWSAPPAAWLAVPWVRGAWEGRRLPRPARRELPVRGLLPRRVQATALGVLFECPFKFLTLNLLRLRELPDPAVGIRPLDRGTVLHEILTGFVRHVINRRLDLVSDRKRVEQALQQAVDRAMGPRLQQPLWALERRRLLESAGKGGKGLLRAWIEAERARWRDGWRFVAAEISFRGRVDPGLPFDLSGRIDRIDAHPAEGELCWDYKTGLLPAVEDVRTTFVSPQLPAYLAAIRGGLVLGTGAVRTGAAYWCLRSEGELAPGLELQPEEWDEVLERFAGELAQRARDVARGEFPARPLPTFPDRRAAARSCERCPCLLLCEEVRDLAGGRAGAGPAPEPARPGRALAEVSG